MSKPRRSMLAGGDYSIRTCLANTYTYLLREGFHDDKMISESFRHIFGIKKVSFVNREASGVRMMETLVSGKANTLDFDHVLDVTLVSPSMDNTL